MSFEITYPAHGNIVEFRIRETLTFEKIQRLHAGLYYSPDWRTGLNCLGVVEAGTDISDVTADALRTTFREEVERLKKLRGPDFKMAWAVEDEHNRPMFKLWQALPFNAAVDIQLFETEAEARAWLETFDLETGSRAAE